MAPTYLAIFREIFVDDSDDAPVPHRGTKGDLVVAVLLSDSRAPHDPPRKYYLGIPSKAHPCAYTWGYMLRAVGMTVDDVVNGYDEVADSNPVLHEAIQALNQKLAGHKLNVTADAQGRPTLLYPSALANTHRLEDAGAVPITETHTPRRRVAIRQILLTTTVPGGPPPKITIELDEDQTIIVEIPHEGRLPETWNVLELACDAPAEQVARSWMLNPNINPPYQNALVTKAVEQLEMLVKHAAVQNSVPVDTHGMPDTALFAHELLVAAFAQPGAMTTVVLGRLPKENSRTVWQSLCAAIDGRIFRWRPTDDGEAQDAGSIVCVLNHSGIDKLYSPTSQVAVRRLMNRFCRFVRYSKTGQLIFHQPPEELVRDVQNGPAYEVAHFLPPLDQFSVTPMMAPNGEIIDTSGYWPHARVWYAPAHDFKMERVPQAPTEEQVHIAVSTICDIFQDFPYIAETGAMAATFACLLDQFARPMINGPRMLYVMDAPGYGGQGTGKTLLARTIAALVTGDSGALDMWTDDEDKLAQVCFAHAESGSQMVIFDNVEGKVDSSTLANVATSTWLRHRPLYSNTVKTVPNNATWCLTSNGAHFSKDLARRTLVIQLSATALAKGGSAAHDRKVKYAHNLPDDALKLRSQVIHACLTILANWVAKGRPYHPDLAIGSYERWAHVIGGATFAAGMYGIADAIATSLRRDSDAGEFSLFAKIWAQTFGGNVVVSSQLVNLCKHAGVMERWCKGNDNWVPRRLADLLRKLKGSKLDEYIIQELPSKNGRARWQLLHRDGTELPGKVVPEALLRAPAKSVPDTLEQEQA